MEEADDATDADDDADEADDDEAVFRSRSVVLRRTYSLKRDVR